MKKYPNEEMAALWNGTSGQAWVQEQSLLDEMFRPIEKLLSDEAGPWHVCWVPGQMSWASTCPDC
jgi:hypothetical protein